jgi:hypothetical protein
MKTYDAAFFNEAVYQAASQVGNLQPVQPVFVFVCGK